jgi:hypothetical protein
LQTTSYIYPWGFDVASDGTIYVPQENSGNILHLDANGNILQTYPTTVSDPQSVAIGPDGNIYVSYPYPHSAVGLVYNGDLSGNVYYFAYGGDTVGLKWSPDQTLWVGDDFGSIYHYDIHANLLGAIHPNTRVITPQADLNQNVWVANLYDYNTGTASAEKFDPNGNFLLRDTFYCCGLVGLSVVGSDMPLQPGTNPVDYYSVTLNAGDSLSAAIKGIPGGSLELLDSNGNLLALAVGGFSNADQYIKSFVNTSGMTETFYLEVIGPNLGDAQYNLIVTRNADFEVGGNNAQSLAAQLDGTGTVLGAVADQNWFHFNANAGDSLTITGSAFNSNENGNSGQFQNSLSPVVSLYDANGNQLATASDNGTGTASFPFAAGYTGTYYVQIMPQNGTSGEYVLNVSGNTAPADPFTVTSTIPPSGVYLQTVSQMTVSFSESMLISSLNNNDFTITTDSMGDTENATSFTVNDDHTVTFYFNPLPPGNEIDVTHTATISGVQDLQGDYVQPYTANLILVNVAPSIVSTSVNNGDILPTGSLSVIVTFNQTMLTSFTTQSSFLLSGVYRGVNYSASSFTWGTDGNYPNDQLTITYSNLPDDNYNLNLYQTGFENPVFQTLTSGDAVNFTLWQNYFGDVGFPRPLNPVLPLGSLVYTGDVTNVIGVPSIVNTDTLDINKGQHITIDVTPDLNLAPEVFLYAKDGTLLATASTSTPGQTIDLNFIPTDDALPDVSTYKIVVDDGSTGTAGLYTLHITLNGLRSSESVGGSSNDTIGTAQSLDGYSSGAFNGTYSLSVLGKTIGGGLENNDVFFVSRSDGKVFHLDTNGNFIASWAITASGNYGAYGATGLELGLNDDLYVGFAINSTQGELLHYADDGTFLGTVPLPNSTANGYFYPFNFDVATDGTFWVPDTNSYNVYHVDASGNLIQNYYTGIYNVDAAQVGPDGGVYLGSNAFDPSIYRLDPTSGNVTAFASAFNYPIGGVKWSPDGTMYAATVYGYLFHYDSSGKFLGQIVTNDFPIIAQADLSGNVWATAYYNPSTGVGDVTKYDPSGKILLRENYSIYGPAGMSVTGSDMPITPQGNDLVDYYSLTLNQGESLTAVVKSLSGTSAAVEIDDGSGNALALGHIGADTVDQSIENFVAQSSGVYYIKISSQGADTYNLVLTRDANFDLQHSASIAGAQDISATITNPYGTTGGGGAIGTLVTQATTVQGTHFDGLHYNDQPCGCLPPDNGFAVSPSYIMEIVNATDVRITDRSGTNLLTQDFKNFFGFSQSNGGDPFVVWDDTASRWYAIQLDLNLTGIEVAVSKDANPFDGFYIGFLSVGFIDFPKIGFNYDEMVITGDQGFGSYNVAIFSFNKSTLLGGDFTYNSYTIPGYPTNFLALMPAKMHGSVTGDPMYFIDDAGFITGPGGTNNAIRVWTGTNLNSGSGTFSSVDLPVDTYGYPVNADQPGGHGSVTTNFAGMISADWRRVNGAGELVGAQNATLAMDNYSTTHAIVYEVNTDTLSLDQSIVINSGPGIHSYMPSAAINTNGDIGMTWIQSSDSEPVSMYEAIHRADQLAGAYTLPFDAAPGSGYMPYSARTGDYSNTVTDPVDNLTFWSSNEYVPPNPYSDIWATYVSS